jgi:hypothetical protein
LPEANFEAGLMAATYAAARQAGRPQLLVPERQEASGSLAVREPAVGSSVFEALGSWGRRVGRREWAGVSAAGVSAAGVSAAGIVPVHCGEGGSAVGDHTEAGGNSDNNCDGETVTRWESAEVASALKGPGVLIHGKGLFRAGKARTRSETNVNINRKGNLFIRETML